MSKAKPNAPQAAKNQPPPPPPKTGFDAKSWAKNGVTEE